MNDDDTQKLPDISHLVNALTEGDWHAPKGDQRYEAPKADDSGTQSLIDQRNSLLNDEVKIHALLATVDWSIDEDVVTCVAGLVDEVAKLRAELRKQQNVIDVLKRARDRYLQRLADVRAERDALKAEDTNGA